MFQRPLPYLYLARQVFPEARIPYQALDSLPLAAEPFAAALDLVLSFVSSEATRGALIELLRCSHWSFGAGGERLSTSEIAAADALLRDVKYVGGWDRLASLAAEAEQSSTTTRGGHGSPWTRAAAALAAAASAATELRDLAAAPLASAQIAALQAFITAHERLPSSSDEWYGRHLRARAAILAALDSLIEAHRLHDDRPLPLAELAGTLRRWIESQTFSPRTGAQGVSLLDAAAAQYADVDEVHVVGLVDSDWPDRGRRSIFYPPSLLAQLGWPVDADRLSAARVAFSRPAAAAAARGSRFALHAGGRRDRSRVGVRGRTRERWPAGRARTAPTRGPGVYPPGPGRGAAGRVGRWPASRSSGSCCAHHVRRRSTLPSMGPPAPGSRASMR